jgi:hypothetical protein
LYNITATYLNFIESTGEDSKEKDDKNEHDRITQKYKLPFSTCVLWGRDHFRTFDGTFYQFAAKYYPCYIDL